MNNRLEQAELDQYVSDLAAAVKTLAALLPRLPIVASAFRDLAANDRQRADGYKDLLRTAEGRAARAEADVAALRTELQQEREAAREQQREMARLRSRGNF